MTAGRTPTAGFAGGIAACFGSPQPSNNNKTLQAAKHIRQLNTFLAQDLIATLRHYVRFGRAEPEADDSEAETDQYQRRFRCARHAAEPAPQPVLSHVLMQASMRRANADVYCASVSVLLTVQTIQSIANANVQWIRAADN
jgi:hypothetical protein